ncbi:MAG: hypothetical protein Q8876_09595 [Bacillota bacterium]|nr:hypothetical protein [Bacillota bacterium]
MEIHVCGQRNERKPWLQKFCAHIVGGYQFSVHISQASGFHYLLHSDILDAVRARVQHTEKLLEIKAIELFHKIRQGKRVVVGALVE